MSDDASKYADIRNAFATTAKAFFRQLSAIDPSESPYALLFEIRDQGPGAWPIGATEESLNRLVDKYIAKGYRACNGNHRELLRAGLRWDAPGDDMDGWYWADEASYSELNSSIVAAFDHGDDYDDSKVCQLCLDAFKQLDRENAFGGHESRSRLTVGFSNVDRPFEWFLEYLEMVNPEKVVAPLRSEFAMAENVWNEIDRPER